MSMPQRDIELTGAAFVAVAAEATSFVSVRVETKRVPCVHRAMSAASSCSARPRHISASDSSRISAMNARQSQCSTSINGRLDLTHLRSSRIDPPLP